MSDPTSVEVLVVGSGPTGLWLALELRRSQINVLVIDSRSSRDDRSTYAKALSISAGSLALFNARGIVKPFMDAGSPLPFGPFGLIYGLNFSHETLGTDHNFNLAIPQTATEEILLTMCEEAGVKFVWGTTFESVQQTENWADVEATKQGSDSTSTSITLRARYVVGCDGTHSKVRKNAGFEFEGTPAATSFLIGDVHLTEKPPSLFIVNPEKHGGALLGSVFGTDFYRVVGMANKITDKPLSEKPTLEELKASMRTVFGSDFGVHSPIWISRFGDACRQTKEYQDRRVFVCGDACHQVIPAGAQGMNLGFADATNLAWKLGAALRGKEDASVFNRLLKTYTTERYAAVNEVLENIRVQNLIIRCETLEERAVRKFVADTLKSPEVNMLVTRRLAGLEGPTEPFAPYWKAVGEKGSPLVGGRLTHLRLAEGEISHIEVRDLCRFVLLIRTDQQLSKDDDRLALFKGVVEKYGERVSIAAERTMATHTKWDDVDAVLIRPDMHIAWAAKTGQGNAEAAECLKTAMGYWWGDE